MNNYLKAGIFAGDRKHSGSWLIALLIGCFASVGSSNAASPMQNVDNNLGVNSSAFVDGTSGLTVGLPQRETIAEQAGSAIQQKQPSLKVNAKFISSFSERISSFQNGASHFSGDRNIAIFFHLASGYSIIMLGIPSINMLLENYGSSERFQV